MEHESAKSKRPDLQDVPTQQPMRQRTKPVNRRAPSADQKRVRRQIQRRAEAQPDKRGRLWDVCANCGERIHDGARIDPNVPWVHESSGNGRCDVHDPGDAVMLRGVDTPMAEPMYHESSKTAAEVYPEQPVLRCQACGCRCKNTPCGACGSIMVQADMLDRLVDRINRPQANPQFGEVQCKTCGHVGRPLVGEENEANCTMCRTPVGKAASMRKGAPFAGYKDFEDCVRQNSDKDDPKAYCGKIKHETEDKKESARQIRLSASDAAAAHEELRQFWAARQWYSHGCERCGTEWKNTQSSASCHQCGAAATHVNSEPYDREAPTYSRTNFDPRDGYPYPKQGAVQMAPGAQTHTREVPEDDEFDKFLIRRCRDHGTSVTGDRPSQEHYIENCRACHEDAQANPREHAREHGFDGTDCWSCCGDMYIARPGERESGRTAKRKMATSQQMNVATSDGRVLLNRGDKIRVPTGQTVTIRDVRKHESSGDHYYLDTDAGTTVVPWSTAFEIVPQNMQQQSLPGFGTPGANSNSLPFGGRQDKGDTNAPSSGSSKENCPVCGTRGSMHQQGDKFKCSKCGYQENYAGGGGRAYSDAPQQIGNPREQDSRRDPTRGQGFYMRHSSRDYRSAIAKRAATVLDQMKETP